MTELQERGGRVKNPTLRDVARLADVSVATASKIPMCPKTFGTSFGTPVLKSAASS